MWSPDLSRYSTSLMAAIPDANARPYLPFSSEAAHSSSAFLVGLVVLE
jgi:hypothetical protein